MPFDCKLTHETEKNHIQILNAEFANAIISVSQLQDAFQGFVP